MSNTTQIREIGDDKIPAGGIRTYTGRVFLPLDPDPALLDIEDIAHALSNSCRFTGHVKWFYSVGQHSVLCSRIVPDEYKLTALLHDASEAYLSDIARPVKEQPDFGAVYRDVEGRLEEAIAERFGLQYPWHKSVKDADNILLVTEARDLMFGVKGWSDYFQTIEPLEEPIESWTPEEAETLFLTRYYQLT